MHVCTQLRHPSLSIAQLAPQLLQQLELEDPHALLQRPASAAGAATRTATSAAATDGDGGDIGAATWTVDQSVNGNYIDIVTKGQNNATIDWYVIATANFIES